MINDLELALKRTIEYISATAEERYAEGMGYNRLNDAYQSLTAKEKEQYLDIIKESCSADNRSFFGILLALFDHTPSSILMKYIYESIVRENYDLSDLIAIEEQLRLFYFMNQSLDRIYIREIHDYIVNRAEDIIDFDRSFIHNPKRIVILTKQILGERHATTKIMVNLYQYLVELGYEVRIVVTNTNKFTPAGSYWSVGAYSKINSLFEDDTAFCINYYGIDVYGYYLVSDKKSIIYETKKCIEMIRGYQPFFIFNCDGFNYISDMLDPYYPIACMGFTNELPTTSGRYIIRYFDDGLTDSDVMKKEMKAGQKIFSCIFEVQYSYKGKRRDYEGKMKEGWRIAIVGNRLDDEVKEEFEYVLKEIMIMIPDVVFVFIGNCPILEKKYSNNPDHYSFTGYVEDLEGALSECEIFINPPRIGGSGAALLALKNGVPVITLPDCDVASYVGEVFTVNDYNEYINMINKSYNNREYYMELANKTREEYKKHNINPEESRNNIKKCIDSIMEDYKGL